MRERDIHGKEYLEQVDRISAKISRKMAEIQVLEGIRDSVTVELEEKVQTSNISDFGDISAKIIDLQYEVDDLLMKKTKAKMEILKEIKNLDNDEQITVLIKRYLQNKTLTVIAKEEYWGYSKAKSVCGMALENFRKMKKGENL